VYLLLGEIAEAKDTPDEMAKNIHGIIDLKPPGAEMPSY